VLLNLVHVTLNQRKFRFVRNVSRIFLPTVDRTDSLWSFDLTALLVRFMSCHLSARQSTPTADSAPTVAMEARSIPTVYLKEDVHSLLQSHDSHCDTSRDREPCFSAEEDPRRESCTCEFEYVRNDADMKYNYSTMLTFEKVVVLGTLDLSTPFLMTRREASLFRTFVRWYFRMDGVDGGSTRKKRERNDTFILWTCPSDEILYGLEVEDILEEDYEYSVPPVPTPLPTELSEDADVKYTATNLHRSTHTDTLLLGPNDGIRITIICRPTDRYILNLKQVPDMLEITGVADMEWLHSQCCTLMG